MSEDMRLLAIFFGYVAVSTVVPLIVFSAAGGRVHRNMPYTLSTLFGYLSLAFLFGIAVTQFFLALVVVFEATNPLLGGLALILGLYSFVLGEVARDKMKE